MANRKRRLNSTAVGRALPLTIPVWWVNTLIGVFLLPVAFVWTETFFTGFSREALDHGFWASAEFWFFALGAVLWIIAFFGLPRPLVIYVFGHELTHALWVWMMGGRVLDFKYSAEGGHIIADRHNFWIALAPYFFPLYSLAVIALYGLGGLFWDLSPHREWLYGLIGATWAFHISFTLWMIPKGQTDLTYHGTFFSLVVIYLMNLAVLTVLLMAASPRTGIVSFGREFMENASDLASWAHSLVEAGP